MDNIGLMRVKGIIKFNDKVQPINYGNEELPPGSQVLVTGWGATLVKNNFNSEKLHLY